MQTPALRLPAGILRNAAVLLPLCAFGGNVALPSAPTKILRAAVGRIEGVASIAPQLTTARQRVRLYDEPGTPPAKAIVDENRFANVVMYLDASPALTGAAATAQPAAPALRQTSERFAPHILPVRAGTTVAFPNEDPIFHNVFSLSRARTFDLGRYPKGESRSVVFSTPGVVQVFCHIHADMSAFVLVLGSGFFVVPDAQGNFVLDNIPPGDYRLVAWHERIKPVITPVHIESGRTLPIKVRIPLPLVAGEK